MFQGKVAIYDLIISPKPLSILKQMGHFKFQLNESVHFYVTLDYHNKLTIVVDLRLGNSCLFE